jgi:hypothetical protein
MNNLPLANSLSVSVRVYRALLVAYPKAFRKHYETQMVQVFRDSTREAYHHGGMSGVIDLWLHTFADLVVTALMERIMERSQYMFSPKVILWGGLASLFGGLFLILAGLSTNSPAPLVLALVLGLGGLASLYSRQAGQGGKLALAGFVLGIIGTGLALSPLSGISGSSVNLKIDPVGAAPTVLLIALGFVILGVGLMLLGVTSLRRNALHRWPGLTLGLLNTLVGMTVWLVFYLPLSQGQNPWDAWSLIGGHVVYHAVLVPQVLSVLLGVGWMGLGILIATEANAQVAQPPEASAETR